MSQPFVSPRELLAVAIGIAESGHAHQLIQRFAEEFYARNPDQFTPEQFHQLVVSVLNDSELSERIGSEIAVAFTVALQRLELVPQCT